MSDRQLRCPSCDGRMREVSRRDVQVDICTECKGVYLDRGELDKLMEAVEDYNMSQVATVAQYQQVPPAPAPAPGHAPPAPGHMPPAYQVPPQRYPAQQPHPAQHGGGSSSTMSEAANLVREAMEWQQRKKGYGHGGHGRGHRRKKGGLLGEIFDL